MDKNLDLKEIWQLQKIDSVIQELEELKSLLPEEPLPFKDEWQKEQQDLEEMKKNLEAAKLERKSKEGEIAANEEKMKKLNIQLYSLKTNKEYQAMLKEIDGLKEENGKMEDAVLELMEKIEGFSRDLGEKEKQVKAKEQAFKDEEDRVNGEIREIEGKLSIQRAEREKQKTKIGPDLYAKYEKIRQGKSGSGIVGISDNSCGGCHINLPPQVINEVKMHKVVFCGNCSRLLYREKEELSEK